MTDIPEQLEKARTSLLDMTLRNKLLSFKEYKRSTASVIDEIPSEIYNILVLEEKSMNFLPGETHPQASILDEVSIEGALHTKEDGTEICLLCDGDPETFADRAGIIDHLEADHAVTLEGESSDPGIADDIWSLPELSGASEDRHTNTKLQTPHDESNLQKRLYHIHNRAEALIEDAGYNALHLAIGFLEWTEAQAHDSPNRAPLILIPVTLNREGVHSAFEILWTGEEVTGNLSLELKLSEQGFELPEFEHPESKQDIRGYLEKVGAKVEDISGWEVVADIHLGFFDYTKFVMYQDLDPDGWEEGRGPADHELIRALLDPDGSTTEPAPFDEADIASELSSSDSYHVMDADPSQIAAIEDVKRGRNMVIEGPPGTGKSQTIVNMIAELLAEDKTVLFVSEKLAALEVVKERLDSANIGDFALELHSDKASKSDFLDELEKLAKVGQYPFDGPGETFQQIEQYRRELNAYANALGSPYGELEQTPYALIGQKEEALRHFEGTNRDLPQKQFENPKEISPEERQDALSALRKLRSLLESIKPIERHPWNGCHPGQVLPQDRGDIERSVHQALETLQELQIRKSLLEDEYSVRESSTLADLEMALEAAEILQQGDVVEAELLQSSAWNRRPHAADDLIELLEDVHDLEAGVGSRTEPNHVTSEIPELLSEYRQLHDSVTRIFRPNWYRLKGSLSTLFKGDIPDNPDEVIQNLEDLIKLQTTQAEIADAESKGRELFGSFWRGSDTDPEQLRTFSNWIVQFRQQLLNDILEEGAIEYLAEGASNDTLGNDIEEVRSVIELFENDFATLKHCLDPNESIVFGSSLEKAEFDSIASVLEQWQSSIDRLDEWSRFDQSRSEVDNTVAAPILDLVNGGDLDPEDVIPCFNGNLADSLLASAFSDRDALAQFDTNVHEDRISNFQELDRETLQLNRKRVLSSLVNGTPQLMQGASKSSQAGTLMHEFGKQRMHKPIRILMQEAGELIQQLKPCFMMSPLSVAKYLDPETMDFDVVIFDEASQVRPADALGTIMRGNQAVLFGDTKQLPPTSFFDQVVDHRETEDEDEWAFNVQDVESVLDLARSSFPAKRLKWHYRSKHESLIAVSNQEFYDNDLLIYPSPVQNAEELGLKLTHLPETTYDRGGSSVNRGEARAVAEAAAEHYRKTPSKSLGIGTFSTAQQEAVREEIERLRMENKEIDEYFSRDREEHFFVKNLERIQGDERDVIFISVGYGYDADGGFSHNFGPLNNTGGWRRLNVLITRSRERCEVFSNFTANAIDMSATNARGVKSLKVFLEYAENRNLDSLTEVGNDPDSPFERSVIEFLRDEGYDVHPQVGCAGFRIDIAIPDPDQPGRYVLGIECDGAAYHSTPVARARDRQRQAILEDRGWEIYRIWSTDWYRSREATQAKVLAVVDEAIERGNITTAAGDSSSEDSEKEATADEDAQVSIEDLQVETGISLDDLAEEYKPVTGLRTVALSSYSIAQTTRAVKQIVDGEGPIHRGLLEQRIVEHSDVQRRGKKVKMTLEKGISNAVQRGDVAKEGEFYYPPNFNGISPRKRTGEAANIEWIPEEEIRAAIEEILEYQYSTAQEELIVQTARVLGFDRTGKRISDRLGAVIDQMEASGELKETEGVLAVSD